MWLCNCPGGGRAGCRGTTGTFPVMQVLPMLCDTEIRNTQTLHKAVAMYSRSQHFTFTLLLIFPNFLVVNGGIME